MEELTGTTIAELATALNQIEDSLNYGGRARLQIVSGDLPTEQEIDEAYNNLVSVGFHVSRPISRIIDGLPVTELVLTKGSPQWATLLIPLIPTLMIGGLIAFGIVKIEAISKALMPLLLVLGGTVIAIVALATRPAPMRVVERVAERIPERKLLR